MSRFLLISLVAAVAAAVLAAPATTAGNSLGPPGSTIYVFPDCASCASVSEAAPGHPGYNGGRWKVVQAFGITSQLTNAEDVVAQATSLVDTGTRFVCPLSRA